MNPDPEQHWMPSDAPNGHLELPVACWTGWQSG
jgi:hypothetical protein